MRPSEHQVGQEPGHGEIRLERPFGLLGGIALVIGGVIGMGIYALIAAVASQAGSALWLAFTIAIFISIIGVVPLIQIASALPRAGGGYLYTSRLLNPLMGTLTSNLALLGASSLTAMVAVGLAGYIGNFLPLALPVRLVALSLLLLFLAVSFFGLRLATWLQMALAAQLIVALAVYAAGGCLNYDISFSLAPPQGIGGMIMAVVLCYSVCMGFQVVAEMGEEMRNARRNIPLSLFIGGGIVLVIYILVGTVFISVVPYDFEKIKAMTAPLTDTGKIFLPAFWVIFLSIGALSAGLTSFNAAAIALPRELFSQARDGIMPNFLKKIDRRTRSPLNAVAAFFLLVMILALTGQSIDFLGVMAAVGILMMTAIISIAAVRLPKRFPERYQGAYFKVSKFWLTIFAAVSVISSLGFVFIVLMQLPVVGIIYIAWTALIIVYYFLRVRWLKKSGFDWDAAIDSIPGFDEE
jgi:APA family basic amino acid/polyamine antiporter